jgi:ABC-type glycerol-3-phosphate transport system permease component
VTSLRKVAPKAVLGLFFLAVCYYWIYPFLWLVSISLKTQGEVFREGLRLVPRKPQWQNYADAWVKAGFGRYTLNTVLVTAGSVLLGLARTSTAGYVLGRYSFAGKRFLLVLLVATFVVPNGYTIIPIVDISRRLGTLNSLWGIILVLGGSGQVANVLLFMGYFSKIPAEMEESAKIDGAGFYTTFFRITLPLAQPIVATVAVMSFLGAWNSFFVPLVFTFSKPSLRTLAVGMMAFAGTHETDWTGMAAAAVIALVPVVVFFFFVQRYFVEGLAGAVKG